VATRGPHRYPNLAAKLGMTNDPVYRSEPGSPREVCCFDPAADSGLVRYMYLCLYLCWRYSSTSIILIIFVA
jgi:hypothetical protein